MANTTLAPEVKDILERSTITPNSVILPPEQLDRRLYEKVNKALSLAGGRWNKKAGAHLFTSDPCSKLGLALETGVVVDEKKQYQAFFTPALLAARLAEKADVRGCKVLEPSAGHGAIANACIMAGAAEVVCVEKNPEFATILRELGYSTTEADFLSLNPTPTFDRVVMNPPFTRGQDVKHVTHALRFLKPNGRLVAVMMAGDGVKGEHRITEVEHLPRGTFKESGTDVAAMILTLVC